MDRSEQMEKLKNAKPGYHTRYNGEDYVKMADPDPPYTSGIWVNIETGEVVYHWSNLLEDE